MRDVIVTGTMDISCIIKHSTSSIKKVKKKEWKCDIRTVIQLRRLKVQLYRISIAHKSIYSNFFSATIAVWTLDLSFIDSFIISATQSPKQLIHLLTLQGKGLQQNLSELYRIPPIISYPQWYRRFRCEIACIAIAIYLRMMIISKILPQSIFFSLYYQKLQNSQINFLPSCFSISFLSWMMHFLWKVE